MIQPYYEEDGITIYNADCRDVLPQLRPQSVDLVLTDPPYAIPTVIAQSRTIYRNAGDLSICESYFKDWMRELMPSLTYNARLFMFSDQASYPVIFRALYGFCDVQLLVWDKGRIGMGSDFRKSFELIAYGAFDGSKPIEKDGIGHSDILRYAPVPSAARHHPAEKPLDLLSYLLKRFSPDLSIDPFMGSGTTLVAAKALGLKAIGIEIERKYCDIAIERLRQRSLFSVMPSETEVAA